MVITFIVTAAISVTIGLLIGSSTTYCCLKKQKMIRMGRNSSGTCSHSDGEKSERPLYEEVTTDKQQAQ